MSQKVKLELTWIGKEDRPRLEPRILIEDPTKSHHAASKGEGDIFDNMLIHGDNLLALKALETDYAGKVKCVFIDPPYNTGSAFEHYDDGLEHSLWLSLMRDRLEIIRKLLDKEGSLWITIDDNEAHYLKVICDEVFSRRNFIGNIIWEKSDSPRMDAQFLSNRHDHLLVYAKEIDSTLWNRIKLDDAPAHYDRTDDAGRKYYTKPLRAMGGQGDSREARPTLYYGIAAPDQTEVFPIRQDGSDGAWRWTREKYQKEVGRIDWVKGRSGWTPYFRIYAGETMTRPVETIWPHKEVGSNRTSKAEIKSLYPGIEPFSTPKPERLIERVLSIATKPGDLVLDSFAGSGTTGAVAHKMGRRWIMIELGDHAVTHVVPRLQKVIDGEDKGGVTEATGWQGGGGFRFYTLAPSLLEADKWGRWVISRDYNAAMLAEAMCKHMGFTYAPSQDVAEYWRHGFSSERDFIYVTTLSLTHDQLRAISEDVGPERTLLICCKAFNARAEDFDNLTIKKIPHAILARCEWGKDDYSLKIASLPEREPSQTPTPDAKPAAPARKGKKAVADAPSLFDDAEG